MIPLKFKQREALLGASVSILTGFLLVLLTHRGLPPSFGGFFWLQLLFSVLFCAGVYVVVRFRLWRLDYDETNLRHRICIGVAIALPCLFAILLFADVRIYYDVIFLSSDAALNHTDRESIYLEMLDAWRKGQLHLDLSYDTAPLEALKNPYSWSERSAHGISYPWDRAYFQGKFYSYFGVMPLFLLWIPVYLLTGRFVTEPAACVYFCILAYLSMVWLLRQIRRRMPDPFPLVLYCGILFTLPFGCLLFALESGFAFYQIAILSGIACACGSLAALFAAVRAATQTKKVLLALASGILLAGVGASRPNLLLYAPLLLFPLWELISDRSVSLRLRAGRLSAFAFPVLTGGILLMVHNYLRFGSVWEFGASYQLTVLDMRYAGNLRPDYLYPAIHHYFLQLPEWSRDFPFFSFSHRPLKLSPIYCNPTMGAWSVPLTWGVCSPALWKKKKSAAFCALLILLSVALAFFDTCTAGVHQRYLCDVLFVWVLAGSVGLLSGVNWSDRKVRPLLSLLLFVFCLLACALGLALTLNHEWGIFAYLQSPLYRFLRFCIA